jgi:exodeoxyribonuclease V alpha subunit
MPDLLTGLVERITFRNDDNGYTVLKLKPDKRIRDAEAKDGTVTVIGSMPEVAPGESLELTGTWIDDSKYGKQFRAETVTPVQPDSLDGIRRYLSSGIVAGIGEATADKIVKHFGRETLDVLNRQPTKLLDVPGLKPHLAEKLVKAWEENVGTRQTYIFLQNYGVSPKMAKRIHDYYGNESIPTVQKNPYTMADDVFGIGFLKADQVARNMGFDVESPERIRAGLNYSLTQLANDGNTCYPRDLFIKAARELLGLSEFHVPLLENALEAQIRFGDLEPDTLTLNGVATELIYLPVYIAAERGITKRLKLMRITRSKIQKDHEKTDWPKLLEKLAKRDKVGLSEQQTDAVRAAITEKISVLTGGPGTGKTTTLKMVIAALKEGGKYKVALCSPTGRAAKRLAEATGEEAMTIHRMLGFLPEGGFSMDEDSPMKTDIVIVDESSMLDVQLFSALLKAIPPEAHLMLVGDIDQLPSVGAGNVLRDVIDSGVAFVTRLQTIFRQDEGSHITLIAHQINQGEMPVLQNQSKDVFFFSIDEGDMAHAAELVVDIVTKRIPSRFGEGAAAQVQVLAPMYRGPVGVDSLNIALQKALNGIGFQRPHKKVGDRVFLINDKVMQTRNNYELDVYNGDIGRIMHIDTVENLLEVEYDGRVVFYEREQIDDLVLAYCISTHKSQGSEYPIVVMPVVTQHYMMLQRNLLYTAITRAKKAVVLVGDRQRKAVRIAVSNNKVTERYSGLLVRLQEAIS